MQLDDLSPLPAQLARAEELIEELVTENEVLREALARRMFEGGEHVAA